MGTKKGQVRKTARRAYEGSLPKSQMLSPKAFKKMIKKLKGGKK